MSLCSCSDRSFSETSIRFVYDSLIFIDYHMIVVDIGLVLSWIFEFADYPISLNPSFRGHVDMHASVNEGQWCPTEIREANQIGLPWSTDVSIEATLWLSSGYEKMRPDRYSQFISKIQHSRVKLFEFVEEPVYFASASLLCLYTTSSSATIQNFLQEVTSMDCADEGIRVLFFDVQNGAF